MDKLLVIKVGTALSSLLSRRGDFEDWILAGMGINLDQAVIVDVCQRTELPDYANVSGIIITGSHAMVTDHHEWSERVAHWLPGAVKHHVPILGICYGHQLLAYALGGKVANNPNGDEAGAVDIHLQSAARTDALLGELPATFKAHESHAQSVLQLPESAMLLASSDMDAHQAFVVGQSAWGVQFHPEFDVDITSEYLRAERQELLAQGQDPDRLIETCVHTPYAAGILKRFADIATQPGRIVLK